MGWFIFPLTRRPGVSPPPPVKLPSKRWRDLILRVWHADPLRCPVCQNPMRVIAVIDDPRAVEKILRHLGAGTTRLPAVASAQQPPDRLPQGCRVPTPTNPAMTLTRCPLRKRAD